MFFYISKIRRKILSFKIVAEQCYDSKISNNIKRYHLHVFFHRYVS